MVGWSMDCDAFFLLFCCCSCCCVCCLFVVFQRCSSVFLMVEFVFVLQVAVFCVGAPPASLLDYRLAFQVGNSLARSFI